MPVHIQDVFDWVEQFTAAVAAQQVIFLTINVQKFLYFFPTGYVKSLYKSFN